MKRGQQISVLLFLLASLWLAEIESDPSRARLERDGFEVIRPGEVLKRLPPGYEFLDYKYTIEGCTLSTFHRDVTSSKHVFKTKHPVYTYIMYDYSDAPLVVCPGSHKSAPFLWSPPEKVNSPWVLFDCDLVHAGALNPYHKPRRAVQYKIAHKDDHARLKHLVGINTKKVGKCDETNFFTDFALRKLSLLFSFPINHIFTGHLQNRKSSALCRLIGEERCFYNK
jgi:hypothetical protein